MPDFSRIMFLRTKGVATDDTVRCEPFHQDLHCLQNLFWSVELKKFRTERFPPFGDSGRLCYVTVAFPRYTVELQWLEHLWDHGNLFETWVVRATEG